VRLRFLLRFGIRGALDYSISMAVEHDKWSRWLAETRFGGDEKAAEVTMGRLLRVRDRLLRRADLGSAKDTIEEGRKCASGGPGR
jgi:hypothetical protein